jgi:hypothetical protein
MNKHNGMGAAIAQPFPTLGPDDAHFLSQHLELLLEAPGQDWLVKWAETRSASTSSVPILRTYVRRAHGNSSSATAALPTAIAAKKAAVTAPAAVWLAEGLAFLPTMASVIAEMAAAAERG